MPLISLLIPLAYAQGTTPLSGIPLICEQGAYGSYLDPLYLPCYFSSIYQFFVQAAIILAVLMILVGGLQWLIAIGNPSKVSNAKATITGAVIGLILALTSYLLFAQINQNLVLLKPVVIPGVVIPGTPAESDTSNASSTPVGGSTGNTTCGPTEKIDLVKLNQFTIDNIMSEQLNYAHPDLVKALQEANDALQSPNRNWVKRSGGYGQIRITSVIADTILQGSCTRSKEGVWSGTCFHSTKNPPSLHFGGAAYQNCEINKNNPPVSCAVDLNPTANFRSDQQWYVDVRDLLRRVGFNANCEGSKGFDSNCVPGDENFHIHASIPSCGGSGS